MYDAVDDPETYTTARILEHAYALGVASVCGDHDEHEAAYDRLKRESPDAYDESIIELAYDEGRASALDLEAEGTDEETVWERLVETEFDWIGSETDSRPAKVPETVRPPNGEPPEGPPEKLDLPSFLRRE
jgi:hypothetical protein